MLQSPSYASRQANERVLTNEPSGSKDQIFCADVFQVCPHSPNARVPFLRRPAGAHHKPLHALLLHRVVHKRVNSGTGIREGPRDDVDGRDLLAIGETVLEGEGKGRCVGPVELDGVDAWRGRVGAPGRPDEEGDPRCFELDGHRLGGHASSACHENRHYVFALRRKSEPLLLTFNPMTSRPSNWCSTTLRSFDSLYSNCGVSIRNQALARGGSSSRTGMVVFLRSPCRIYTCTPHLARKQRSGSTQRE
ncbi:hypothetical protein AB1N83_008720 [Pleurotus pulmonarius]